MINSQMAVTRSSPSLEGEEHVMPISDKELRYRQSVNIGYVEMERIVEEIVIPEFQQYGAVLMEHGYEVEVVVLDTDSPLEERLYVCSAGIRITRGRMTSAIVYTGDPYRFEFVLQMQSYTGQVNESSVAYHRLTPQWFHKAVTDFLTETCSDVDFGEYFSTGKETWELYEGPFIIQVVHEGVPTDHAEADSLDNALAYCSKICHEYSENQLIVVDKNGREVV